jgi:hypothetical protein
MSNNVSKEEVQIRVRISDQMHDYLIHGHKQWMDANHIKVSFNSYVEHLLQEGLISDGTFPAAQFEDNSI